MNQKNNQFSKKFYSESILYKKNPDFNLGSNQVDLGGITCPASATLNKASIGVGYKEKATFHLPESTNFFNSSSPFMPPTK